MRAGGGLQGDRVHAGDFDETALQKVDDLKNPLRQRVGAVGMRLGQALDAGDRLIDARVVLHGAGAQRIHAQVDRVVPSREPREVADDLDFAQLGEQARYLPVRITKQRRHIHHRHVERRQLVSALPRRRLLEDERLVLRLVGADFTGGA